MIYVLKIAYDGSHFLGSQRQSQGKTVQGELERQLSRIFDSKIEVDFAGRTDRGVHASGQVASFTHPKDLEIGKLCHSLNCLLRDELCVQEASKLEGPSDFHPRFSARSRSYSYFLMDRCSPREAVFNSPQAWCLAGDLDTVQLERAIPLFLGEQDFTSFSFKTESLPSRVRTVFSLSLEPCPTPYSVNFGGASRLWRLEISANGFLRRMVRLITAGLVEVGLGLRTTESLRSKLEAMDSSLAPHPAPPNGLFLDHIGYDPCPFESSGGGQRHKAGLAQKAPFKE